MSAPSDARSSAAGYAIGLSTVLMLVFVAHHPVVSIHDHTDALQRIVQLQFMDRLVHGALIALLLALLCGFARFADLLGLRRLPVLAGLVCYGTGCIFTIGAAIVDGFIVPDLAQHFVDGTPDDVRITYDLLVYSGLSIQNLTKLGLILISVAILAWAWALQKSPGMTRIVGLTGMVAGGVPAALILFGGIMLEPKALLGLLLAQSIWNLTIAALLVRGKDLGQIRIAVA